MQSITFLFLIAKSVVASHSGEGPQIVTHMSVTQSKSGELKESSFVRIHKEGNTVTGHHRFTYNFNIFDDDDEEDEEDGEEENEMTESSSPSVGDGNTTAELWRSERQKRASDPEEKFYTGASCIERLEKFKALAKNKPVQTVIHVEQGEEARLTCHYCEDKQTDNMEENRNWDALESRAGRPLRRSGKTLNSPILWYRIAHIGQNTGGYFRVEEVRPSLRDNDAENRVYVSTGHTLVIENATEEDQGTYFCRDTTKEDRYLQMSMSAWQIQQMMTAQGTFKFIIHLNVLMSPPFPPRKAGKKDAWGVEKRPMWNLQMETLWGRWGRCSTCGQPGERKKTGICMMKKIDENRPSASWYVDSILSSQTNGVPCRSQVFRYGLSNEGWRPSRRYMRPDEYMEETCEKPCRKRGGLLAGLKKNAISPLGLKKLFKKEEKQEEEKKVAVLNETEGVTVELKCPGTKPADMVMWMNNSLMLPEDMLENSTGGRASVDPWGTLKISPLLPEDSGLYMCVVDGKDKGHVFLNVAALPTEPDYIRYRRWIFYSFIPDFIVFCCLMWVKHNHRKRILISAEEALTLGSSSSSSNRDTNINASTESIGVWTTDSYVDVNNSSFNPLSPTAPRGRYGAEWVNNGGNSSNICLTSDLNRSQNLSSGCISPGASWFMNNHEAGDVPDDITASSDWSTTQIGYVPKPASAMQVRRRLREITYSFPTMTSLSYDDIHLDDNNSANHIKGKNSSLSVTSTGRISESFCSSDECSMENATMSSTCSSCVRAENCCHTEHETSVCMDCCQSFENSCETSVSESDAEAPLLPP